MNDGYSDLVTSLNKKDKAYYLKRTIDILDNSIDDKIVIELIDYNSCCKGKTARKKASISFSKINKDKTLEEKIELISDVKSMGKPKLIDDKTIYVLAVNYYDGEKYCCACPTISKVKIDMSKTYCKCCGEHFRFYYQIMLGLKLKLKELSLLHLIVIEKNHVHLFMK